LKKTPPRTAGIPGKKEKRTKKNEGPVEKRRLEKKWDTSGGHRGKLEWVQKKEKAFGKKEQKSRETIATIVKEKKGRGRGGDNCAIVIIGERRHAGGGKKVGEFRPQSRNEQARRD